LIFIHIIIYKKILLSQDFFYTTLAPAQMTLLLMDRRLSGYPPLEFNVK